MSKENMQNAAEDGIAKLMLQSAFEAGRRRGFYQICEAPNDTVNFEEWYQREYATK